MGQAWGCRLLVQGTSRVGRYAENLMNRPECSLLKKVLLFVGLWSRPSGLVDVELLQRGVRVVEGLEEVLVVLDHLAAHVDPEPLLVHVQLIAVEQIAEREVALRDEPGQVRRALEAERDRLEVGRADRGVAGEEHRRAGERMAVLTKS